MWDRLPLPAWSAAGGRVVLLGDAAHAMYSGPGQGARTAFEDAHQMFLAIKQHWPNPAAIAAQYEVRVCAARCFAMVWRPKVTHAAEAQSLHVLVIAWP
jgi:2-polyprenyl-6-methoxyphenol hydroxylase-like FAD-dependent oxidoreductase